MRVPHSPIGSLMAEHRLIERVLAVMSAENERIGATREVYCDRVDAMAEFLAVYGDRNHHGKEEDILFARLADKQLAPEHAETMRGLIDGHRYARGLVKRVRELSTAMRGGDQAGVDELRDTFSKLAAFYPDHIETEDHHFFKPAIEYFSHDERVQLERDFEAFDRALFHDVYEERLALLESTVATRV